MNSLLLTVFVAATTAGTLGAPGPDCSPASMQGMPVKIKNMCAALWQFSSALQTYIDEQNGYQSVIRDGNSVFDTGVAKRQDVDHVFLRFGRRR